MKLRTRLLGGATALATVLAPAAGWASSHREAPFISKNPKVDGTDFYMFDSYETGRFSTAAGDGKQFVTILANYIPLEDAYGGPNYFGFDPAALYEIHIDNNGDAVEDITFQFSFTSALAGGDGIALMVGATGAQKSVAIPFQAAGPLSSVGGVPDQSSQNVLDKFSVGIVRGPRRATAATPITESGTGLASFNKPSDNIGTKTLPNYPAYVNHFIYNVDIPGCTPPTGTHSRIFVGQRQEGFAVNLGQIFDLVNVATTNDGVHANVLGALKQTRTDGSSYNITTDKNVSTIAIEVPASCLVGATSTVIGGWTTASVRQARVINPTGTYTEPAREGGPFVQVSRLGMPLVNEVVIGLKDKDKFNGSEPKDDGQFADYVTNPTLPAVLQILFGSIGVVAPTRFPRADLVTAFLTGVPGVNNTGTTLSEMLRLNTALPPTTNVGTQQTLGAALCFTPATATTDAIPNPANPGCDLGGFPNGRRPGDDVVDISLRVAEGYLIKTSEAPAGQLPFVDGANYNATEFDATFPYLKNPIAGSP